ncbi:MAG: ribonuclease HIII [Deltaproteobacteria bacterium]|nr:ribonuclease HIII [Deltaproteobacteria bacterium]
MTFSFSKKRAAAAVLDELPGPWDARIGCDESGKGDYFGPLVTAAVRVDESLARQFAALGVRDSKKNSDAANAALADRIKALAGPERHCLTVVEPAEYNVLHARTGNLNKMLAWAHVETLGRLLEHGDCPLAVVDKFGADHFVEEALAAYGRRLGRRPDLALRQIVRGERDLAVAAASILARAGFVGGLKAISVSLGYELRKGASAEVDALAARIWREQGRETLASAAKMHFANTKKAQARL